MSDHDTYRGWSASYVLGALTAPERLEFERHLSGCDECRREVADFAAIPGLLSRIEAGAPEPAPPGIVAAAAGRVRAQWSALERSRRRWRWTAVAALVVAFAAVLQGMLPERESGTEWQALSTFEATGSVTLDARAWGTAVHLDLAGLPPRDGYVAWVVAATGQRQQIAVWGPTPSGRAVLDSASSVRFDDVAAVVVTDPGGDDEILLASG